ncbi:DUF4378 domain protein [Medicago truncatula]|nr:DUF4378 domain protein [Medicago truncatula]
MPSVLKAKVNANFNKNESIIVVREVKCSSVSTKGQNSLKKKIEHVTGESKKEKIRVGMDSVIHKIPQGQEISDGLKKEILKKLTDPIIIPRENQYKSSLRRIKSLQELLESYPQFEEPKLEKEKENSPLGMVIPLQRTLSLPDLQSFTYASLNEEIFNVHSKNQLQFDKLVEDLAQEKFASTDESDSVISNIVKSGSDCIDKINGMVDLIIDDFGHNGSENCSSFNDQYIEAIREYRAAIAASDSKTKPECIDRSDNVAQKMESLTKKLNHEIHVDTKLKDEFNYVKYVLEISGLTSNDSLSAWHSRDTPVDPSLYEEMENDPDFCPHKDAQCNHQVLFDLINETMLEIYGRSDSYPPMVGCHTLHKVWTHMSKSLCLRSKGGQKIDDHVSRDLSKNDGWVNGQFHDEGVGLEVEDMVFHDLLEEIMLDFACL